MNEGLSPGTREVPESRRRPGVLGAVGLGLAYLAAGLIGGWLAPALPGVMSPTSGVALVGLLLLGWGYWPVVWVAAAVVGLVGGVPLAALMATSLGSALGPALSAFLLERARLHPRLDRVRDVLVLTLLGAGLAPAIPTVFSTGAAALTGTATASLGTSALVLWLGASAGILVVAPFLLALASDPEREGLRYAWAIEAVVVGALALFLAVALFGGRMPAALSEASLLLPLPLLIWGAFRFGLPGTSGVGALFLSIGALLTARGTGPFTSGPIVGGSATFPVYAISLALTALLLRALVAEHRGSFALLQSIFDSSSEGILVLARDQVIRSNSAAGHLFGTRGEKRFVGVPLDELSPPRQPDGSPSAAALQHHLREAGRGRGGHRFDWVCQRLDGSTFQAEVSLSSLVVDGEPGFLAVVRDVTTQKAHQAMLQRAREEADRANVSKTQYLARVSHDIRSALTSNVGFSRLMTRDESLPARARDHAERIHRSGLNIMQLVNEILETAKVEVGRLAVTTSSFELGALLQEVEATFLPRAGEKGIELAVRLERGLPPFVRGDQGKIRQILTNLLGNAIKFTTEGTVSLSVDGTEDPRRPGVWTLRFRVADSGPGIPASEMDRIFRRPDPDDPPTVSTVLGLPGSLELARVMGGSLTATSREGSGTTLVLEVPLIAAEEVETPPSHSPRVLGLAPGEEVRRILIVDDREENRTLLATLLGRIGFEVKEAADGGEAIQVFGAWEPHLLLMNRSMPTIDGLEATRRIKVTERGKRTPIILVTAGGFDDERDEMLGAGADGVVELPFAEAELLREVERHLRVRYVYEEETDA